MARKKARDPGPVENGRDRRAEEQGKNGGRTGAPKAPDGVSGNWS